MRPRRNRRLSRSGGAKLTRAIGSAGKQAIPDVSGRDRPPLTDHSRVAGPTNNHRARVMNIDPIARILHC
jgi:hypothetical protein